MKALLRALHYRGFLVIAPHVLTFVTSLFWHPSFSLPGFFPSLLIGTLIAYGIELWRRPVTELEDIRELTDALTLKLPFYKPDQINEVQGQLSSLLQEVPAIYHVTGPTCSVGKSTCAAALACLCRDHGEVLLIDADTHRRQPADYDALSGNELREMSPVSCVPDQLGEKIAAEPNPSLSVIVDYGPNRLPVAIEGERLRIGIVVIKPRKTTAARLTRFLEEIRATTDRQYIVFNRGAASQSSYTYYGYYYKFSQPGNDSQS